MRFAVAALALLLTAPAHAGGVGVMLTGGAHTERMWFHSNLVSSEDGGEKVEVNDPDDFEQYEMTQTLPHGGLGLETILGDRDDRITGVFRFYYLQDAPQADPASAQDDVAAENVIAAYRAEPRHIGIGLVGLNWGIIGNPDGFQGGLTAHMGSGFLTSDHTEFLVLDVGPSFQYMVSRQVQAFADVGYQTRYRKGFSHGAQAVAGVRYLFD